MDLIKSLRVGVNVKYKKTSGDFESTIDDYGSGVAGSLDSTLSP